MYAVIRVRGHVGVKKEILDTMKMLRLNKANHMVLLPDNPSTKGMLQICKDYVTWGEIDKKTLAKVLEGRGRLTGNKNIDKKAVKTITNGEAKDFESFAGSIMDGEVKLKALPDVKPVFRLHPPRKGYKSVKHPFSTGGDLGYRGKEINDLIGRMI